MNRKLIIEGNAVYEIDEECMLKKRMDKQTEKETKQEKCEESNSSQNS